MAQRKVNGKDILLFIDPAGGTSYKTLICLTDNSLARSTGIESANSKCGPDSGPGDKTQSISFSGQVVYEATTDLQSSDLHALWSNSTDIGWKMGTATPATGDVVYSGNGWISELTESAPVNGRATFTGTISVTGDIVLTETA